jgi:uncharacterized protein YecE (DUF72 family)
VGPFYPPKTSAAKMLPYYSSRLSAVEANYTFRKHPEAATLEKWRAATPDGFLFACKANQGITHFVRLAGNVEERIEWFVKALEPLGDRLGPVLVQTPPNLKYDPGVLANFLAVLREKGGGWRYAFEPRHESFDSDEVRSALAEAGVAWCVADTEEAPGRFLTTARHVYLRLRREGYPPKALDGWAETVAGALDAGQDVFAFFKHEEAGAGALDALALTERVNPT